MKYLLALILVISQVRAIDLGSLDTTFSNDGTSDGWDISGDNGFNRYGSAVLVDSVSRVYVAGTYDYQLNGNNEKGVRLERFLANGTLDNSFGTNGVINFVIPPAPSNQFEYTLEAGPSDSVFLGYSRLYCITGSECHSDIKIYYLDSNGTTIDNITVPFDLGSTWDRQDDNLSDMVFIPTLNRLAITAEVELSGSDDTDFGVAVIAVDPVTGALSMDSGFDNDGKQTCYFDQDSSNGGAGDQDRAKAIVYNWLEGSLIAGGFSYEGNGLAGDGTNLAFCEFNIANGSLLRKWSTEPDTNVADEREYFEDMVFVMDTVNNGGVLQFVSGLIVAATLPGPGNSSGTDFGLTKFSYGGSITGWERNLSFGSNGTGTETTNFQWLFVGNTDDYVSEILLEQENASIVLVGNVTWDDGGLPNSIPALAKYTYGGILDTNWGIGKTGKALTAFDLSVGWDNADAVAIDPNNEELYITGFSYDGLNFKRLIANFYNDQIFGGNFDF